jgi:hypothetical protein
MFQRMMLTAALALGSAAVAFAAIPDAGRSAPQAVVQSNKAAPVERFAGTAGVAYRVDAAAWDRDAVTRQKSAQRETETDKRKPLQVGFPREIPAAMQALPLSSLDWQTLPDGSKAVRISVVATDAAGLRVGYRVSGPAQGLAVRFAGNGRDEIYLAESIGKQLQWSPVLEGETATMELHLKRGFDASQFVVQLETLSHLIYVGADLGRKDIRDIGDSGSCNIDVACVSNPSQALLDAAKATAKMIFTDPTGTYLCTGTLLNSSAGAPYFYGAAHCIDTQAAASTLNTYWFFDAVTCNSTAIPPYQLITGGATLLVTDPTMDVTLLQLNQSPPNGAVRAAWNASVIPTGATVVGIHHPRGDLKKFSQGTMRGYAKGPAAYGSTPRFQAGKDSFINIQWFNGTTEGGSSGSGVFTYNSAGYYELRGGLEGGAASCSNLSGLDRYSRMDLLFTRLAPYLQPSAVIPASNGSVGTMVEYFNPQAIYYFMTSRESEKSALDTVRDANGNPLFYRTGYWFKVDPFSSPSTSSVTRYLIPGAAQGGTRPTHFYTALNADKTAITATGKERFATNCTGVPNGFFCNEGIDSYVALPIGTGASATCLGTEVPIYRVFRGTPNFVDDANHRYLTNLGMYQYMVSDQGWTGEAINFCAKP